MEGAILESMKKVKKKISLVVPSDIINLIFLELPVKILLKFKCVCREWTCIMEDPEFVDSYRIRSHKRSRGVGVLEINIKRFRQEDEFKALFIVNPEEDSEVTRIRLPIAWQTGFKRYTPGVIEGLVCFDNFVLNPSTKEVIKLPDQEGNWACEESSLYYLGFDAHFKTYKVLTLRRISDDTDWVCRALLEGQILTLGTTDSNSNSWRDVIIPEGWVEYSQFLLIHAHLSVDNKIFFLISPTVDVDVDDYYYGKMRKQNLLIFGVKEERFIGVLKELPWDLNFNVVSPLEVNGRLAMMEGHTINWLDTQNTLWILEDYDLNGNGTWIKRNILFPMTLITFGLCFPVCTVHSSSGTEILFKGHKLCLDPKSRPSKAGSFSFYFYYNLETDNIRIANGTSYHDLWHSKHVETMFQLKPRPQPTPPGAVLLQSLNE